MDSWGLLVRQPGLPSKFQASEACLPGTQRLKKGIRSSGTRVMGGCELSCDCWEIYPSPLQELHTLLTDEPPLEPTSVFL